MMAARTWHQHDTLWPQATPLLLLLLLLLASMQVGNAASGILD
jgi:hypothetical protein